MQVDALVTATGAGGKTILHVATAAALPSLLAMDSVKQLVNTVDDDVRWLSWLLSFVVGSYLVVFILSLA